MIEINNLVDNIYLIDTHSHIDLEDFSDDLEAVVENAANFGVKKIIVPSVDRTSFDKVIQLTNDYENVFCALGIHPTEAKNASLCDFESMEKLSENPKVVAIGECGLDYYWDKTYIDEQKKVFLKQIEIAKKLQKPLIIHDREAHKDTFDLLTQNSNGEMPIVMHCFSGSIEFAMECIRKGFYIGIGGVVTFKNAKKMHEVAEKIPLENLLLETDAPYLTPMPFRGKRNEPAYVKLIAEEIAKIRGISVEEVAQSTTINARKVFGI